MRKTTVIDADAFVHACHRGATTLHRREFMTLLAGATAAWPLAAHAQEMGRIPKIGVLWHAANAEEEGPLFEGLVEGFRTLGYTEGRNIRLEHRFPNEVAESRSRSFYVRRQRLQAGEPPAPTPRAAECVAREPFGDLGFEIH
jgi:hypothetical protein